MPNWTQVTRIGLCQVADPRRRREADPRGVVEEEARGPQEGSPLLPFGQRGGPPLQPYTYAEAAASRSPPPPTQGAASEALHRGWPELPRSTREARERMPLGVLPQ